MQVKCKITFSGFWEKVLIKTSLTQTHRFVLRPQLTEFFIVVYSPGYFFSSTRQWILLLTKPPRIHSPKTFNLKQLKTKTIILSHFKIWKQNKSRCASDVCTITWKDGLSHFWLMDVFDCGEGERDGDEWQDIGVGWKMFSLKGA